MSSSAPESLADCLSADDTTWKQRLEEHERRMREDPAYRAEIEAEDQRREADRKRQMEQVWADSERRAAERRRSNSGMPPRVWELMDGEDGPEKTEPVRAALEFMKGPKTLLFLAGGEGCGKTVGACAAMEIAFRKYALAQLGGGTRDNPHAALFIKAIEVTRAGSFDHEFFKKLRAPSLLVLDDLGTEPLDEKGWTLANIRAVLDERYDLNRKTVSTTNLPLARFTTRYCGDGGRLLGRIREAGAFVEFTGGSLRGRPAAQVEGEA